MVALHKLLEAVILARNSREVVTALALLTKAVEGLLDGLTALPADTELMLRYRDCHLLVLKGLQDVRAYGPQWTNKNVTRYIHVFFFIWKILHGNTCTVYVIIDVQQIVMHQRHLGQIQIN